ncbi:nitrate- and nitrite sensing domain-containing protein [Variovorax soli]|uniref:nitrate- and nitrite sensing domain-containing protein n=1 Tax=Variovorax soli TaxID=376815 RepID=UPI0008385606|nr:nitrate- and nitrite sensing domain-containing protein [Variovorax soli]
MPETATLSPAQLVLHARQREIDAMRQLEARAGLVEALGQLIHALQRERGASSIFLASQGQHFSDVRRVAVEVVQEAQGRLRELVAAHLAPSQGASARILSLMAWVLLDLDALPELRARIERQALSAHDAVAAYSTLIAGQVELIFHVADATLVPGVSPLLVAFLHLVQGKEAAGQERAVGSLMYASGQCVDEEQQRVIHLIDSQDRSLQVFSEFADAGLRARWEAHQLSAGTARLERLRRTMCAARPGGPLDRQQSDAWFEVSSARIDVLWDLEVALMHHLRDACEAQIRLAEQELQDSEGMLRRLRDNPPPHTHAVERFFDQGAHPDAAPALMDEKESSSLLQLLQSQSARLAGMEAQLDAARRALHERKVIERAKGVLMSRLRMSEEAAFRALQKTSMDQNRRLLDVAEATLALSDEAFAQLAAQDAGQPPG